MTRRWWWFGLAILAEGGLAVLAVLSGDRASAIMYIAGLTIAAIGFFAALCWSVDMKRAHPTTEGGRDA